MCILYMVVYNSTRRYTNIYQIYQIQKKNMTTHKMFEMFHLKYVLDAA